MNNAPGNLASPTRRTFLQNIFHFSLLFSATGVSLLTAACSDGDNENSNAVLDVDGNCQDNGTHVDIQITHTPNHTLLISRDDVNAGAPKTYTLENNGSGHTHTLSLTNEDFTMLKNNIGLRKNSSADAGHSHLVNVSCA